jgi:hypothetical protein
VELTSIITSIILSVVIPAFTLPKNVLAFAKEDMPNYKLPLKSPTILVN